jgi:hypothetical protein
MIAVNHRTNQAVFRPTRKSVKAPWEEPGFDARPPLVPFKAPPQLIPVSPTPTNQSLIQGNDRLLQPCSHRQGQVEPLEPSPLKSQVPHARPQQRQPPTMPQKTASTISVLTQTTESELPLFLDRGPPYNQPVKYQISKKVDDFDDDTVAARDRPSSLLPHVRPDQTPLRFDKSVNTDIVCENFKERDAQEPKFKRPELAVPKISKGASKYAVTGAAERLDTSYQFLRDLSADPERFEAPGIEKVMWYVTSKVR